MASTELGDKELLEIANRIGDSQKLVELGFELGLSHAKIKQYLATNRTDGEVSNKGTRGLLFDWRESVSQKQQRTLLRDALMKAKFVEIAEDL